MNPAELLPHAPPMVLLDRIEAVDESGLTAAVTVGPATRFADPDHGVPAHIGIEWMAQACGAFAGLRARTANQAPRPGYLLGSRDFQSTTEWFRMGETLRITIRQIFHEDGMAVFDCSIDAAGTTVGTNTAVTGRLTVYQPQVGTP